MERATCIATPNIAVIKYWGMRDEKLVLPTNSSLSFTMDETLRTETTVASSVKFKKDEAWINGSKLHPAEMGRINSVLVAARKLSKQEERKFGARIVSKNNFPAASGLASSASGIAALACATCKILLPDASPETVSKIARLGSGSASRSVFGGFVEWRMGDKADGSDSFAKKLEPASHWKALRNVIAIVETEKKKVPSNEGMQKTVRTSKLFQKRLTYLPGAIRAMKKAVRTKDYPVFAETLMAESDNMHSCMLDTKPPLAYLNAHSKEIIHEVRRLNSTASDPLTAYTFDAGPNAHLYTLEKNVKAVREMLAQVDGIKEVRVCKVGNGPRFISSHLIDEKGKP